MMRRMMIAKPRMSIQRMQQWTCVTQMNAQMRRSYASSSSSHPAPPLDNQEVLDEMKSNPRYRKFTRAEVSKHDRSGDLWVVVSNRVFNLSTWTDIHPGGRQVIQAVAGKDATDRFDFVGHSPRARALMEQYCIGYVEDRTRFSGFEHGVGELDNRNFIDPESSQEVYLKDLSAYQD